MFVWLTFPLCSSFQYQIALVWYNKSGVQINNILKCQTIPLMSLLDDFWLQLCCNTLFFNRCFYYLCCFENETFQSWGLFIIFFANSCRMVCVLKMSLIFFFYVDFFLILIALVTLDSKETSVAQGSWECPQSLSSAWTQS